MKEIFENIVLVKNNLNSLTKTIGYLKRLIANNGNKNVLSLPNEFDKYTVAEFLRLYKINQLIEGNIVSIKDGETHRFSYLRHLEIEKQIEAELANNQNSNENNLHLSFLRQINDILIHSLNRYHILDPIVDFEEFVSFDTTIGLNNSQQPEQINELDSQIKASMK